MKILCSILLSLFLIELSYAQNTWTQLANVGVPSDNPAMPYRGAAVALNISGNVYWGTGESFTTYKDWWKIDPATKVFTQMADFAGSSRGRAVGFTIGEKGYVGTGIKNITLYKDFYEYDPSTNTWTKKADVPGGGRQEAVAFSIGNFGYVGTGHAADYENDFWQYNPATNHWTQKANFGGAPRTEAMGFSIDGKGYLGTGFGNTSNFLFKDFWEYNPDNDTWTQKANFGGGVRGSGTGCSVNGKGYMVVGDTIDDFTNEVWEYDPVNNLWTRKNNYPGETREFPAICTLGDTVAFVSGPSHLFGVTSNEFYTYKPSSDLWQLFLKTGTGDANRYQAVSFGANGKGYIATGNLPSADASFNDIFEFDPATNTWQEKSDLPANGRQGAVAFTINDKGYVGTGWDGINKYRDFWKYDPVTDVWTQQADFPGTSRYDAAGFATATKGYIGLGFGSGSDPIDFWSYDPATNHWTQAANFPYGPRQYAVSFSIGTKGYLGIGEDESSEVVGFYQYDEVTNTWSQKSNFPGVSRRSAVGFTIAQKGYVGLGSNSTGRKKDFWEYDPSSDTWTQLEDFAGGARAYPTGFSLNGKGYVGTGIDESGNYVADFWEFNPCQLPEVTITANGATSFCNGNKVKLTASGTDISFYQWSKDDVAITGATNATYNAKKVGSYKCIASNNCSGATSNAIIVNVFPLPAAKIKNASPINICEGETVNLKAKVVSGASYQWFKNDTIINSATNSIYVASQAGSYTLEVTSSENCSKISLPVQIDVTCKQSEENSDSWMIYPNPASDQLVVQLPMTNSEGEIVITDILGKKVITTKCSGQTEKLEIDVRSIPEGMYLLQWRNDSSVQVTQIEIKH